VIGAGPVALREIDSKLSEPRGGDSIQVTRFRSGVDGEEVLERLASQRQIEILSSAKLVAGVRRPAALNAGAGPCRLRVQLLGGTDRHGENRLRIKPEVTWKRAEGDVESRVYEAGVQGGSDFVVRGFLKGASDRGVLDQLFPGHSWSGQEVVIVVTAEEPKQTQAALAKTGRRR
jgi:hypothetical protein